MDEIKGSKGIQADSHENPAQGSVPHINNGNADPGISPVFDKEMSVRKALEKTKDGDRSMFGADSWTNPYPFAPNSKAAFITENALFWSMALFFLFPLSSIFGIWYGSKYLERMRFSMRQKHMHVRKGVLIYNHTLIIYENIQDIHIVQGIWDRIFGMYRMIVYTATVDSKASTAIPGLKKEDAESFKKAIFEKIRGADHVSD